MTLYDRFRGCIMGCFGIPLALLILVCPALGKNFVSFLNILFIPIFTVQKKM